MKKETSKKDIPGDGAHEAAPPPSRRARMASDEARRPAPVRLGVPDGLGAPDATLRLVAALSEDLDSVYRLVELLGEDDADEDDVVEWLSTLAASAGHVLPGQERAWLLRTLLRLIGARAAGSRADDELPLLHPRAPEPTREKDETGEGNARLLIALHDLDPATRAAVVLVVHEGLSLEEAAKIQGGTRGAFAERYAQGVAQLGDDLIDVMLGRHDTAAG